MGVLRQPQVPVRPAHRRPRPGGGPAGAGRRDRRPRPPARRRGPAAGEKVGAARSARERALGRGRDGLTTKVIPTAADEDTALAVDVLPGQPTTPRTRGGCSTGPRPGCRWWTSWSGTGGSTGTRSGTRASTGTWRRTSRAGGTGPWPLDKAAYRARNTVERLFAKAKQFRRAATRYEKLRATFLGVGHLALGFVRLRRLANAHRTWSPQEPAAAFRLS
ncbi:MAG: hypothetical protein C0501_13890 [Isosphaera sp.]|nr:hypothetical protein [Isosphaera sp.]